MYEYNFTITDQFGTYSFIARFADHFEADRFITENEAEGGQVVVNYYRFIEEAEPLEF